VITWLIGHWGDLMLISAGFGLSFVLGFHHGVEHTFKCLRKSMDEKFGVNK
jgi:hypothetical protein